MTKPISLFKLKQAANYKTKKCNKSNCKVFTWITWKPPAFSKTYECYENTYLRSKWNKSQTIETDFEVSLCTSLLSNTVKEKTKNKNKNNPSWPETSWHLVDMSKPQYIRKGSQEWIQRKNGGRGHWRIAIVCLAFITPSACFVLQPRATWPPLETRNLTISTTPLHY